MVDLGLRSATPDVRILILLVTVVASVVLVRVLRKPRIKYRYPPGPKGIPIFGNLFQLPPRYPGEKLLEWGKQYGDMSVVLHRASSCLKSSWHLFDWVYHPNTNTDITSSI